MTFMFATSSFRSSSSHTHLRHRAGVERRLPQDGLRENPSPPFWRCLGFGQQAFCSSTKTPTS